MKKSILSAAFMILLALVVFAGCNQANNPTTPNSGNFLTVTPSDNSKNVSPGQPITFQFASPVNPAIIESHFTMMSDSAISNAFPMMMNSSMRYSQMQQAMGDSTMMSQLRNNYSTRGKFSWNSDNTKVVFTPDSSLMPNMEYSLYFDNNMTSYMRGVMSGNNMMGGGMNMMNNYSVNSPNMVVHFWTGS